MTTGTVIWRDDFYQLEVLEIVGSQTGTISIDFSETVLYICRVLVAANEVQEDEIKWAHLYMIRYEAYRIRY